MMVVWGMIGSIPWGPCALLRHEWVYLRKHKILDYLLYWWLPRLMWKASDCCISFVFGVMSCWEELSKQWGGVCGWEAQTFHGRI